MRKYGIHFCAFDRVCRSSGAPPRVHLRGPKRNIGIALSRNATFANAKLDENRNVVLLGKPKWITVRWHPDDNTGIDPVD